jgi:hypothetical protein
MATETKIQTWVHKLEEGGWATWIRRAVLVAFIAYIINLWMFRDSGFKGLSHEKAIEQAQIALELTRGHGFSTKMIRPAALWQFQSNKGAFPLDVTPDAYHAPLGPVIDALAFKIAEGFSAMAKSVSQAISGARVGPFRALGGFIGSFVFEPAMSRQVVVYTYDKIVASVQIIFFLLAVLVSYLTAKRLFDKRLALLGMGLLVVCEALWDFSLSGLPQMQLLFLFSCAAYLMVRAIEARYAGKRTHWWAAGIGAAFGVMALTHGLAIFALVGALLFAGFFFLPRGRDAAIIAAVFLVFYAPWLVRNYRVCGNPVGLGWYSGLYQVRGSESQVMRTMALEGPLKEVTPTVFGEKLRGQIIFQFANIYQHFGAILVTPLFFVALLHVFRRQEAAAFRWCIFSMWLFAVLGMAIFGLEVPNRLVAAADVQANDIHVLFIPLMTFYGLAFTLVMWTRLEINYKLARLGFISLIYAVSAAPFLSQFIELHSAPKQRVQWPPYVPPYISVLGEWTTEREIIASDMPWAVAWYADRKSLWLPMSRDDFVALNDYNQLGGRMVGLYLSPVSGNRAFLADIVKGEFKEWAPFILRQVNVRELQDFPLRAVTALPIDNECVFYADRDRWTARED